MNYAAVSSWQGGILYQSYSRSLQKLAGFATSQLVRRRETKGVQRMSDDEG
jgi:hypothetical protein